MARENIAMSDSELRHFWRGVEWVALGTLDENGAPCAAVVAALVQGNRLYFTVGEAAAACAQLERDARVCCCTDVFPSYYAIKGSTVHGHARRETPSADVAQALLQRAVAHGLSSGPIYSLPLLEDAFGFDFGKLARRD